MNSCNTSKYTENSSAAEVLYYIIHLLLSYDILIVIPKQNNSFIVENNDMTSNEHIISYLSGDVITFDAFLVGYFWN